MKWIKCTEELPNDLSAVLVSNGTIVGVAKYDKPENKWSWYQVGTEQIDYKVTHWMSLPESPSEIKYKYERMAEDFNKAALERESTEE